MCLDELKSSCYPFSSMFWVSPSDAVFPMILSIPGTIIEAAGHNVEMFAAGAVFYQVFTVLLRDSES